MCKRTFTDAGDRQATHCAWDGYRIAGTIVSSYGDRAIIDRIVKLGLLLGLHYSGRHRHRKKADLNRVTFGFHGFCPNVRHSNGNCPNRPSQNEYRKRVPVRLHLISVFAKLHRDESARQVRPFLPHIRIAEWGARPSRLPFSAARSRFRASSLPR